MSNHYVVHFNIILCIHLNWKKMLKKKVNDLISLRPLPESFFQLFGRKWSLVHSVTISPTPLFWTNQILLLPHRKQSYTFDPKSLSWIDPLWEKKETSHTKSFKSSCIKSELVHISGEIWNWNRPSWKYRYFLQKN